MKAGAEPRYDAIVGFLNNSVDWSFSHTTSFPSYALWTRLFSRTLDSCSLDLSTISKSLYSLLVHIHLFCLSNSALQRICVELIPIISKWATILLYFWYFLISCRGRIMHWLRFHQPRHPTSQIPASFVTHRTERNYKTFWDEREAIAAVAQDGMDGWLFEKTSFRAAAFQCSLQIVKSESPPKCCGKWIEAELTKHNGFGEMNT